MLIFYCVGCGDGSTVAYICGYHFCYFIGQTMFRPTNNIIAVRRPVISKMQVSTLSLCVCISIECVTLYVKNQRLRTRYRVARQCDVTRRGTRACRAAA